MYSYQVIGSGHQYASIQGLNSITSPSAFPDTTLQVSYDYSPPYKSYRLHGTEPRDFHPTQAATVVPALAVPRYPLRPFGLLCHCLLWPGRASVYLSDSCQHSHPTELIVDEREGKQKVMKDNVLCKSPSEGLLAANLLAANETVDGDGDGTIDVLRGAVFGEAHLAKRFADAHDCFEVADLAI